jgi:hypothetical protein
MSPYSCWKTDIIRVEHHPLLPKKKMLSQTQAVHLEQGVMPMKSEERGSWQRADTASYILLVLGAIFTTILIVYFLLKLDVLMGWPEGAIVVGAFTIGSVSLAVVVGLIGVRRWGRTLSRPFPMGSVDAIKFVETVLTQKDIAYQKDRERPPRFSLTKPCATFTLEQWGLKVEIFGNKAPFSWLFVGKSTDENKIYMKELLKALDRASRPAILDSD